MWLDRFLTQAGEFTVQALDPDSGILDAARPVAAAVAVCLAVMDSDTVSVAVLPHGMSLWKRAALTEHLSAGVEIKDFI